METSLDLQNSNRALLWMRFVQKISLIFPREHCEAKFGQLQVLRRDKDALKYAPKVLQDQALKGSRSYSTSTRLRQREIQSAAPGQNDQSASVVADMISRAGEQAIERQPGLKFDMPTLPLPRTEMIKRRYDPLVEQFTKLLMRDGKLSLAQKVHHNISLLANCSLWLTSNVLQNMTYILDYLRTASPPKIDPRRRLMTSMPSPQLPLNPVLYLSLIVDSVAPLVKIRQQKGIQGGGASVPVPVPLALRQRRRAAIQWILDAADRRNDSRLAVRVAQELTAVAEGRSGIWDKRDQVHKLGVAGRSNLQTRTRPSRF